MSAQEVSSKNNIMQYFAFSHLPQHLQKASLPFYNIAHILDKEIPDGPEKSAGLRKLLEAKDYFVCAALSKPVTGDPA